MHWCPHPNLQTPACLRIQKSSTLYLCNSDITLDRHSFHQYWASSCCTQIDIWRSVYGKISDRLWLILRDFLSIDVLDYWLRLHVYIYISENLIRRRYINCIAQICQRTSDRSTCSLQMSLFSFIVVSCLQMSTTNILNRRPTARFNTAPVDNLFTYYFQHLAALLTYICKRTLLIDQ